MTIAPVIPIRTQTADKNVWQVDVVSLPARVQNEVGQAIQPAVGLAVDMESGTIAASDAGPLGRNPAEFLISALGALALELGRRPAVIQVRSDEDARAIRTKAKALGARVEVCATLEALDAATEAMVNGIGLGPRVPSLQSVEGMTDDAIAGFAMAAGEFHAAAPWHLVSEDDIIHIEAPRPDPGVGCVSVASPGDPGFGITVLDSEDGWDEMSEVGIEAYMLDHAVWSMIAVDPAEAPDAERVLWHDRKLPTISGQIPVLARFGPKQRVRRPSPRMLAFFEGLLRAIACSSDEDLDAGRWRKAVATVQGPMTFTFALPDVLEVLAEAMEGSRLPMPLLQGRANRELDRLLAEQKFASIEEVNRYLESNMGGLDLATVQPETAEEEAEELALIARDASGRAAITLARKAIALWPDCADAYTALGEECRDNDRALAYCRDAVAAGERALGVEAFAEDAGHFWGIHETRPYMRARLALAAKLWQAGLRDEAVSHFLELLRLNPNDNQGVRELAVPAMMLLGDDDGANEVLAGFRGDVLCSTKYNRALLQFRRNSESAAAMRALSSALGGNPHVPDYLLGEIELPGEPPAMIGFGGLDEAAAYAIDALDVWQATPGALDWLRAHRKDAKKGRRKAPGAGAKRPGTAAGKGKTASSGRKLAAKKPKPER
jgi:tetratricopeptide (TPR) repeat protein